MGIYQRTDATFSGCGTYRYRLLRGLSGNPKTLLAIGLNPSTADIRVDDPTVRREARFAQKIKMGTYLKGNLFAFRSTFPDKLSLVADPIGPDNDRNLSAMVHQADIVVASWGAFTLAKPRGQWFFDVFSGIVPIYCFGVTKSGAPRHPLYLSGPLKLQVWEGYM